MKRVCCVQWGFSCRVYFHAGRDEVVGESGRTNAMFYMEKHLVVVTLQIEKSAV